MVIRLRVSQKQRAYDNLWHAQREPPRARDSKYLPPFLILEIWVEQLFCTQRQLRPPTHILDNAMFTSSKVMNGLQAQPTKSSNSAADLRTYDVPPDPVEPEKVPKKTDVPRLSMTKPAVETSTEAQSTDNMRIKTESKERQDLVNMVLEKWNAMINSSKKKFIHLHPKIATRNIRYKLKHPAICKFPKIYTIRTGLPKNIAEWSLEALGNCNTALSRGRIGAEAYAIHPSSPEKRVPKRDDPNEITKTALYEYTKNRLKTTIEFMIGRPLTATNGNQMNLLKDDPEPPNLFQWAYTSTYRFPHPALSQFEKENLYDLIEALEIGAVWVRSLRTKPLDSKETDALQEISKVAQRGVDVLLNEAEDGILDLIHGATGKVENVDDIPEILAETSIIMRDWTWKFTEEYPRFHIAPNTKSSRNRISRWAAKPLILLLLAIRLGNLSLAKRTNMLDHQKLIPRRGAPQIKAAFMPQANNKISDGQKIKVNDSASPSSRYSPSVDLDDPTYVGSSIEVDTNYHGHSESQDYTSSQSQEYATNARYITETPEADTGAGPPRGNVLTSHEQAHRLLQRAFDILDNEARDSKRKTQNLEQENQLLRETNDRLEEQAEDDQNIIRRMRDRQDESDKLIANLERKLSKLERDQCFTCNSCRENEEKRRPASRTTPHENETTRQVPLAHLANNTSNTNSRPHQSYSFQENRKPISHDPPSKPAALSNVSFFSSKPAQKHPLDHSTSCQDSDPKRRRPDQP